MTNVTLLKALIALIPISLLMVWSLSVFTKSRMVGSILQLLGAVCLLLVVLTHAAEAVHVLPSMRWGERDSVGHYLDLSSAILGITLFPVGVALRSRAKRRSERSVSNHNVL